MVGKTLTSEASTMSNLLSRVRSRLPDTPRGETLSMFREELGKETGPGMHTLLYVAFQTILTADLSKGWVRLFEVLKELSEESSSLFEQLVLAAAAGRLTSKLDDQGIMEAFFEQIADRGILELAFLETLDSVNLGEMKMCSKEDERRMKVQLSNYLEELDSSSSESDDDSSSSDEETESDTANSPK